MPAQVVTTIVLVLFGAGLLAATIRSWCGSWEPRTPHTRARERRQAEIESAVRDLRQRMRDYERNQGGGS